MVEERVGFDVIRAALVGYSENYWEDWMNSWMIWFPGHVVTYGIAPPALRCTRCYVGHPSRT